MNNCINLLKDNRLRVAGDKSKLLIVVTKKFKKTSTKNKLAIFVDEDIIEGTKSEKLLGVIINDKLTWTKHLHCDNQN